MKKIIIKLLPRNIKKILLLIYKIYLDKPIINYYKTNYDKNVLISYIKYPFINGINYSHTNNVESLAIGEIFKELGFNIDIVNYDYEGYLNYNKYDLIFGFGDPLVNSFYNRNRKIITIYYGTGMHVSYQNNATSQRIKEVYDRTGVWMTQSGRIVEKAWSIQTTLIDAMICIGNDAILDSYRIYYDGPIYNIPVSYYETYKYEERLKKFNFKENKINFLWFGSCGLIHKGLDLLIDTFKERTDINLHICGPIDNEIEFKEYYKKELYETKNIITHGFINIKSNEFKDILDKCTFVILPSCSEAEATSVVNCMACGLIPIITKEVGINLDLGVEINKLTKEDINKSINYALSLNEQELIRKSNIVAEETIKRNNIQNYKKVLKDNLTDLIK